METGSIEGLVVKESGEPEVEAILMITGDSPSHADIAALTDTKGKYRFDDLVPGEYTIYLNAEGFSNQTEHTFVKAGEVSELNFLLK